MEMFKLNLIALFLIISCGTSWATPPTRLYSYVPNATIDPNQNNTNENALYTYVQTGVDTYAPGSISAADINANASIAYSQLSLTASIKQSDIATGGFLMPSGAVFFMATGSCPSGTTDVSSTYANKYVKINSTQLTSSGVVLTGTTDSHTLSTAEVPSLTYTVAADSGANPSTTSFLGRSGSPSGTFTGNTSGGGGGHTHTISSATTLEPSSITMKACQVN